MLEALSDYDVNLFLWLTGVRATEAHMYSPTAQTRGAERGHPSKRWTHWGKARTEIILSTHQVKFTLDSRF